jgi:CheY-like chemotaxis protein
LAALPKRILMVDDEHSSTRYIKAALEDEGFDVTRSDSTTLAVLSYNDDHYDLIILDRMMPPGEVFKGSETEMDIQTGYWMYQDLRRRWHLAGVPILILTNFYEFEQAEEMEAKDERLRVRRKGTNLDDLVAVARELTDKYPIERAITFIPMDEYPNVAPYYVYDVATGQPVRLYFDRFRDPQPAFADIFSAEDEGEWEFRSRFEGFLKSEEDRSHTLRAMLRESRSETPNSVHALFYTGGEGREAWHQFVLFEAAPWNRREAAEERRLRHVGKALVARFVREAIYRYGHYEELLITGVQELEPGQTNLHTAEMMRESTKEFFLSLGFVPDTDNPKVLRLPHETAIAILQEVSTKPTG